MSGAKAIRGLRDRFFDAALGATRAGTLEWRASPIREDDIARDVECDRLYIAKLDRYAVRARAEPTRCVFEIFDPDFPESDARVWRCETRRRDRHHAPATALIAAIREALGRALRMDAAEDAVEALEALAPQDAINRAAEGEVGAEALVVGAEIDFPYGRMRIVAVPPNPAVLCAGYTLARYGHDCVADAIPIGRSDPSAAKELAALAAKFAAQGVGLEIGSPSREIKPGDLVNAPFGMIRIVDPDDVAAATRGQPKPSQQSQK